MKLLSWSMFKLYFLKVEIDDKCFDWLVQGRVCSFTVYIYNLPLMVYCSFALLYADDIVIYARTVISSEEKATIRHHGESCVDHLFTAEFNKGHRSGNEHGGNQCSCSKNQEILVRLVTEKTSVDLLCSLKRLSTSSSSSTCVMASWVSCSTPATVADSRASRPSAFTLLSWGSR